MLIKYMQYEKLHLLILLLLQIDIQQGTGGAIETLDGRSCFATRTELSSNMLRKMLSKFHTKLVETVNAPDKAYSMQIDRRQRNFNWHVRRDTSKTKQWHARVTSDSRRLPCTAARCS